MTRARNLWALDGIGTVMACVQQRELHVLREAVSRGLAYTDIAPRLASGGVPRNCTQTRESHGCSVVHVKPPRAGSVADFIAGRLRFPLISAGDHNAPGIQRGQVRRYPTANHAVPPDDEDIGSHLRLAAPLVSPVSAPQ